MDATGTVFAFQKRRHCLLVIVFALISWHASAQGCNCPPIATCGACTGGINSLTLRYDGLLGLPSLVVVFEAGGDEIFRQVVGSGGTFTVTGSLPGGNFDGGYISLYTPPIPVSIPNAIINTSCSTPVYSNSTFGSFTVVEGTSNSGLALCCSAGDMETTPPVITGCPSNITLNTSSGCSAIAIWATPSVSDNCGSVNLTANRNSGSSFNVGTTTVTYTATDAYGNTNTTCSFTVTVVDATPPAFFNCPTIVDVTAGPSCNAAATWTEPLGIDNCVFVAVTKTHSPGQTFPLGDTEVTYTAMDGAGNSATCKFTVRVSDTTPPVINNFPSGDIIVYTGPTSCNAVATWSAITASDNCSYTLTPSHNSGQTFPVGTTNVTYTATDPSGNSTVRTFRVIVRDEINPIITGCPTNLPPIVAGASCTAIATWTPPVATDNCSVVLTSNRSPGQAFPLGTTTVNYTATDPSGNTAPVCSFTVTVVDNTFPVFSNCPGTITVAAGPSCNAAVNWPVPTATDNCSVVTTSTHTPGEVFPIGTTEVTYTATDGAGHVTTCKFNVVVNDTSAPVFDCLTTDLTATVTTGCEATLNWTEPTYTDCSPVTLTSSHRPGDSFPVGETNVIYTALDNKGNLSTCSFIVTVEDKLNPVFESCPSDISIAIEDNSCETNVSWTLPVASDNCDGLTLTSSHQPGSLFTLGTTEVEYMATDASGNISYCRFTVFVSNDNPPVFENCLTEVEGSADDSGYASVTWDEPTAYSPCGGNVSMTSNYSPGDVFPLGTTDVVYIARDESGNESRCSFKVVVKEKELVFEVIQIVTPNGDGKNDEWVISNLEEFLNNKVTIVDRWGSEIYRASGYDNNTVVWRGVNSSGAIVPSGTYFYTIEVNYLSRRVKKTGFIEVVQ